MRTSKNVIFPEKNKVAVVEEEVPDPGPGEVQVEAVRSLISTGTETLCLRGVFDPGTNWAGWVRYPFHPGYSMAGRVVKTGEGVTRYAEGDRVYLSHTHNAVFNVPEDRGRMAATPEGISDETATWAFLAVTTQLGVRRAELKLGESVGVVGLGILGQLVVQYLSLFGVRRLVAIDPVEKRLELAEANGATHGFALGVDEAREPIADLTGGRMLDVVLDVTGHPAVLAPAIALAGRMGRIILLGDTTTPTRQSLAPGVVSESKSILGIHGTNAPAHYSPHAPWTHEEMVSLFYDYVLQGKMNPEALVSHRYAPDDAPAAYELLETRRSEAMGVIFTWDA